MLRFTPYALLLCAACTTTTLAPRAPVDRIKPVVLGADALRIARDLPAFDGHNDLPGEPTELVRNGFDGCDISKPQPRFHTDIPRLLQGGVGAQFSGGLGLRP